MRRDRDKKISFAEFEFLVGALSNLHRVSGTATAFARQVA